MAMLPTIANTQIQQVQTTLVATPLPDTNAMRAPYDNVAPSVSSAQIHDNARGKGGAVPAAQEAAQAAPSSAAAAPVIAAGYSTSPGLSAGAQTILFAQMLAQTPAGQGAFASMMIEYEKLVAFSQVKYKPSLATQPPPAPSGLFGKIMQQQKAAAQTTTVHRIMAETAADDGPEPVAAPAPQARPVVSENPAPAEAVASPPVAAIGAYEASAHRTDAVAPSIAEDSA